MFGFIFCLLVFCMPPMFHLKPYEFLVEVAFPVCKIDLDTDHVTAVGDWLGRHCASSGLPAGRLYIHPPEFYVSYSTYICMLRKRNFFVQSKTEKEGKN